ncbi:MAG TPA: response regulator transcription factor [Chloroflexota bacterium]|nr:response regulator transcription factor [Chloroflexota bacterium]
MRILLVEDDEALGKHVARGLREEQHTVDIVTDGDSALDYAYLIREGVYDLAILDILLPDCDGITVCREWRKLGLRIPILMLTARRAVEDRVLGLDVGADDYLTKPFAFAELVARVRALGRREPQLQIDRLQVGDLSLDPISHRVERHGKAIDLTPREFRILELLLRNPGQVLTRDQIAERAWDLGAEHASNVVDVFVHTLRRKIDAPYEPKLLHTVRGTGYTLREPMQARAAG